MIQLPRRLPRLALAMMAVLLLAGAGWLIARHGPLAPVRVTAARVARADLQPVLFGIGTVEARRSQVIGPTTAGRVARVLVDVGEHVLAGQLLAEMEPVDLDERAAAAGSAVARARNSQAAAQAQLRDAEVRFQLARANADRYAALAKQQFFSQAAVEGKEQEAESARAGVAAARASAAGARDDLARLLAEAGAARRQRANLQLRAPASGVITSRDAEPGTTVVAGQGVLRLMDPTSLWVKVRLDQGRSGGIREGLPAQVVLRATPGESRPGRVARVEPLGDGLTEEKLVEVSFDRLPSDVAVNEMAEVTVTLPRLAGVLSVPSAAIHRLNGREGVWSVREGRAVFLPVRTGIATQDGQVQILSGLAAGEVLVLHAPREILAGETLSVAERP